MTYQRPTRPSNIGKVIADGLRLFRAGIRSLYVPAFCLLLVIGIIQWGQIPYPHIGEEVIPDVGHLLRLLATFVANIYMSGVIIAIAHYIASGAPAGVRSPLAIATRRFPVMLATSFLCAIAISIGPLVLALLLGLLAVLGALAILGTFAIYIGVLLMLVPAIFLAVALFASLIVAVAEGQGPVISLRESFALVRGFWWRTFAILAILTTVVGVASLATNEIILFLANRFDHAPVANTVSTLTYAAIQAIVWPLSFCLWYSVYQDLRLRQTPHHDLRPTD